MSNKTRVLLLFCSVLLSISALSLSQPFAPNYKWQDTSGPYGCDATSFFVDKSGNYWLGTGSSGGVYFSGNMGKSWKPRNNGIGPVHVSQINEIRDTIYIQVSDLTFNRDSLIRYYRWLPKSDKWDLLYKVEIKETDMRDWLRYFAREHKGQNIDSVYANDPKLAEAIKNVDKLPPMIERDTTINTRIKWLQDDLDTLARTGERAIQKKYPLDYSNKPGTWYSYYDNLGGDWGVYPYTVTWGAGFGGVWEGRTATHITGFADSTGPLSKLNNAFPRDMYVHPAGNIFYGKTTDIQILLAKSGLYQVLNNELSQVPVEGLCATDVRQIVCIGKRLVALVGESDIWEYSNNQWKLIFNAWEHHKASGSWYSIGGFDTKQLNALPDGRILFCFAGDVWQISPEGLASILFSQHLRYNQISVDRAIVTINYLSSTPDSASGEKVNLYYTGMSQDKNGTYWTVANWRPYGTEYYITVLATIPSNSSKLKLVRELRTTASGGNHIYCYTFNDRAGSVWLRSGREMRQIGAGADTSLLIPTYGNLWLNSIALKNDGSFSYLNKWDNILYTYNSAKKVVEQDSVTELVDMTCIGYDNNNNLYAGTGKRYSFTCGNRMYQVSKGLFKLEHGNWKYIPGEPNKWILSIGSNFQGTGLPIGTSGSGLWLLK
jgi:hypothetical protein